MKVERIKGKEYIEDSSIIKDTLDKKRRSKEEYVFILQDDMPIFEFIEQLDLSGYYMYILKVAKEIEFDFKVSLKTDEEQVLKEDVETLSEVIEEVDEDNLEQYKLVLYTEDKDVVSDVIQQLIYLDCDIDVLLKEEERERKLIEYFKREFNELEKAVKNSRSEIEEIEVESIEQEKENIINILASIETNLDEVVNRDLRISVMATKKAGKSMVVNSFLGEEYAPTSLELPTPNTCIYKQGKENEITLRYNEKEKKFNTPKKIKKFIHKKFKEAQNDQENGYALDDMEIEYENKDKENVFSNYTIIDTPGPDLAGTEHKDIAYKWIKNSDVVLFVVDYTKHLTDNEEEFLKDIKKTFERYDKFHSMIIVVNKLDQMYTSEESKSAIRFLDYLRSRLKDLGYEGIRILGTSALQYFYALKAPQLKGCEGLDTDDNRELMDNLDMAIADYIGQKEMTLLDFIEGQLRKLKRFHGIRDATLETLKKESGMIRLKEFTNYIATEKANTESYKALMRKIDEKFSELKNKLLISQLQKLEDKKEELEEKIDKLIEFFEDRKKAIQEKVSFQEIKSEIEGDIERTKNFVAEELKDGVEFIVEEEIKKIKKENSDKLQQRKKGYNKADIIPFDMKIIENRFNNVLGEFEKDLNSELDKKEKELQEIDIEIQNKIKEFNQELKKEYNLEEFDIVLPKLDASFSRPDVFQDKIPFDSNKLNQNLREAIEKKDGFFEFIKRIFRGEKWEVNQDKLRDKKNELLGYYGGKADAYTEEKTAKLKNNVTISLENLKEDLNKQTNEIVEEYKQIFENIKHDLRLSKKEIDEKVEFLQEVEEKISEFEILWNDIRIQK
ncbi:dynamin family protein [Halobacteroides halobius DSM 5150]|uniref:Dynamin family protein n=1 Tax=Halobacteroides halobius (strain ATCC 35273 / DSM 5150 / MD-1) TaxID=748449 RepID=L0K6Z0_HALHC|nr:dynamin family protein [Halobacteroides halobius]AGB41047.1 dynamin family protein [Halobacteroides halobius DSM 5150]